MCFKHLHKGHHPILDLLQTSLYSAQHFKRFIQLNICRMSSFILNSIVWVQPLYLFLTVWRDEFILLIQSVLSWIHLYKYLLHICEDCITSKFLGIELLDFRAYVCILLLDFIKLLSEVVIWDRNIFWHYWDKWKYFKALWFSLYIYPEMISHREWHRCATLRPLHCPFHAAYCGAHGIVTALLSKAIFKRFYLFIFRERGREGERQGEKHGCVREASVDGLSQTPNWRPGRPLCALTENWTSDLLVHSPMLSPLSHTSQGLELFWLWNKHGILRVFWVHMALSIVCIIKPSRT